MRSFISVLILLLSVCNARLSEKKSTKTKLGFPKYHQNRTFCEILGDLPEHCECHEPGTLHVVVECLKPFNSTYFNDTIGMKIDMNPCDPDGSSMSIDVTEMDHNIDLPINQIRAGEEKNLPIPGLSVHVPGIMNLGLDVVVLMSGNLDELTCKVGLNACAGVHNHQICASAIPGLNTVLPWWVLSGTYSFGDICESNTTRVDAGLNDINILTAIE
mmetsp:Transcript_29557/g.41908  ORF Transcript_29557/g.41908 Transcript_29557/m.41908 type:complete len:216 (+) Transcript_29557:95-742(+)|eukprot:CAMPEP_0202451560 /NCGR_PEP_ID=MMETSP1360-20130828/9969_1 /ASSEMBLY_ACC=CAM_ASM_000848 /TAXON_ID=515479 /ORGANISM="Licmophora paradoxa, Strain CCMP2313" /LENGTH=215 /DNA_ID=CAMNT_0049070157 /DNA_START=73 /DNA_END=720 /DNA_ORIENTATION=-